MRLARHNMHQRALRKAALAVVALLFSAGIASAQESSPATSTKVDITELQRLLSEAGTKGAAGDHKAALELCRKAASLAPDCVPAHLGAAKAAAALSDWKAATAALDAAAKALPAIAEKEPKDERIKALAAIYTDLRKSVDAAAIQTAPTEVTQAPSKSEVALACEGAKLILAECAGKKDRLEQLPLLTRALDRLRPILRDPRVESVEAWRLAGVVIALKKELNDQSTSSSENLTCARLIFCKIEMARPDFDSDPNLLKVMAALDVMEQEKNRSDVRKWARADLAAFADAFKSAQSGRVDSQRLIAEKYSLGVGTLEDRGEAVRWYEIAAKNGDTSSELRVGNAYRRGEGVPKDLAKALEYYRRAYAKNNSIAARNLAEMYYEGAGLQKDVAQAAKYYREFADVWAIATLPWGRKHYKEDRREIGQGPLDREVLRKEAETGDPAAQNHYAWRLLYDDPRDGKQESDYAEAITMLRSAAAKGEAMAQLNLGEACWLGRGVPKEEGEGAKWFLAAAKGGNEMAQYNLGVCYFEGRGVTKDYEQAVTWFRKLPWYVEIPDQSLKLKSWRPPLFTPANGSSK